MRSKTFRIMFMAICLCGAPPSSSADCGRKLQERVYYGTLGSHRVYEDDATLERVDIVGVRLSLTLIVHRRPVPFFSGPSTYLVSADLGHRWQQAYYPWGLSSNLQGKGGYMIQASSNPNVMYKWLQDVGLYLRSEDHGNTWRLPVNSVDGVSREDFASRISGQSSYRVGFRLAAVHPIQPLALFAGIEVVPWAEDVFHESQPEVHHLPGLYVSYDGGERWTKFTDAVQGFIPGFYYDLSPLGISPSDPQVMYGYGRAGILKSTDGGKNWTAVGDREAFQEAPAHLVDGRKLPAAPTDPGGLRVVQFAFDPANSNLLYVVSNKGVYRTEDGGEKWSLLNLGFDVIDAYNSLGFNTANPKELFIGTTFGLYYSKDQGCHFQKIYPPNSKVR